MNNLYRKKRNRVAKVYFASFGISVVLYILAFFLVRCFSDPLEMPWAVLWMLPCIGASSCLVMLLPMLIYFANLTIKASAVEKGKQSIEDLAAGSYLHDTDSRKISKQMQGYLTEKTINEGRFTLPEAIIFFFGLMEMALCLFSLCMSSGDDRGIALVLIPEAFVFLYICCGSVIKRKMRSRSAMKLALWFRGCEKPTVSFPELENSVPIRNAVLKCKKLIRRNYLENVICDEEQREFRLLGVKKRPRNAYICKHCGAAQAITVGSPLICGYCDSTLE